MARAGHFDFGDGHFFSDASPRHDSASLLRKGWRGQIRRELRPKAENRANIPPVEIHVGISITDILDPILDFRRGE